MSEKKKPKPKVTRSGGSKKSYVVEGAILKCSFGDQECKLKVVSQRIKIKDKAQANIMDFKPNINIKAFGKCSSLSNPAVAAATAANRGKLEKMPCTPVMTIPWINGKQDKKVGGHPALLNNSTNMCLYCGKISIKDDGQNQPNPLSDLGKKTTRSAAEGAADAVIGKTVIDKIKTVKTGKVSVPRLGPAASMEVATVRTGAKLLKGASKVAGPVAVASYGYDVYQDVNTYNGVDAAKAVAVTTAGTGVAIGAGLICSGIGAPLGVALLVGTGVGVGVSYAGDWVKKAWIGY